MKSSLQNYLTNFIFQEEGRQSRTHGEKTVIGGQTIPKFINEFWTSKQRQAHSLHEVSYRACFKPQLPRFFIELLTKENDVVYDPFSGRGTTILEAALLGRNIVANDINPLSKILSLSRLNIPAEIDIDRRLDDIPFRKHKKPDIDLSMFFHEETLHEILSLKAYLQKSDNDAVTSWIRMIATNRLTGHSKGFFSVYTLPPNQATSQESQKKINKIRNQKPEYRDVRKIIVKKSKQLLKDVTADQQKNLRAIAKHARFFTGDARETEKILSGSIQLTVTSPPFLDVVQYAQDNWLRCWFNGIDAKKIGKNITMSKTVDEWSRVMGGVFNELYRITKKNGWVAFEVGEIRNGKVKLDEYVVQLGAASGFTCEAIMVNSQQFTKTANIWGISNNARGTNTNRIVIFRK